VKLVIGADHAGFPLKEDIRAYLAKAGHEVVDLGAYTGDLPDDYPDFAEKVGGARRRTRFRGYGPGCATILTPRTRGWSTTT
jgi:ribose 5-phosphate isomerase RpiB